MDELYRSGRPDISIELFPPKSPEGIGKLFETVGRLKKIRPAFFSVTYGAGGSTRNLTLELCGRLKNEAGVETTCHLSVIGQSKEETRENLRRLKAMGVYNLLALRGDPPKDPSPTSALVGDQPHSGGFTSSLELIAEAHRDPWFSIAVTGFPEVHPAAKNRAADMDYLRRKLEAGGSVVLTQFFLDTRFFFEFMDLVRKAGITAPVIPGILPILSAPQLRRFAGLCKATIPPAVERELAEYEEDDEGAARYGIELATAMCAELLKSGVPGLHFYALNRSAAVEAILKGLGLPG